MDKQVRTGNRPALIVYRTDGYTGKDITSNLFLDYDIHIWYKCFPTSEKNIMQNKIVLHFLNGGIAKGTTLNFFRDKDLFHFTDKNTRETVMVEPEKLKGIFFVRNYDGNPGYRERYDVDRAGLGMKLMVTFNDGETLVGYTSMRPQGRTGFFLFVPDANSNNEKVFVLNSATEKILLK
jgi:hypothetical protein